MEVNGLLSKPNFRQDLYFFFFNIIGKNGEKQIL